MEGTPFLVEEETDDDDKESRRRKDNADKKESRRPAAKKPEAIGMLAVEPKPERIPAKSPLEQPQPVPETEAPDERLGEEEARVIVREMVMAKQAEQETESADPAAAAGNEAVEHFRNLIVESNEDLDSAYNETLAELGVEAEEDETSESFQPADNETEEPVQPSAPETAKSQDEDKEVAETGAGDGGHRGTNGGRSWGNPAPRGPDAPVPPFGPPGESSGSSFSTPEESPDESPPPPIAAEAPAKAEYRNRANPAAMALFGGIIGYLVGRRRGRIKTEKKLLPIQKKLEKEVEDLHWEVERKEAKIRAAAAEKQQTPRAELRDQPEPTAEQPMVVTAAEQVAERQQAPERLGHVLLAAEAKPAGQPQKAAAETAITDKSAEKTGESLAGKRIDTLGRAELLDVGEKIVIDGSNLRQIYETHLIGERGLRRLVAEHMHGGDLRKALQNEVMEREMDFERDPVMRDLAPSAAIPTASSNATLDKLLEKADVKVAGSGEQAAFFKAQADYEAVNHQRQHQQQRRLIDIGLIVVITILVLLVTYMYLSRG